MKYECNRYPMFGFTERLQKARENKGISKKELADKIKVTRHSIKLYESGEVTPTFTIISKIATELDVSLDYLAFGKEKK